MSAPKLNFPVLRIWEGPRHNASYVLGADTSTGESHDESGLEILKLHKNSLIQVAELQGHIDPDLFSDLVVKYARAYNRAFCVIEVNGNGFAVNRRIFQFYDNIYRRETFDGIEQKLTSKLGWATTAASKPTMLMDLKRRMRLKQLFIPSSYLLSQLQTYIRTVKGTVEASGGCRDDLVISMALAVQGAKHIFSMKDAVADEEQKLANLSEADKKAWRRVYGKVKKRGDDPLMNSNVVPFEEIMSGTGKSDFQFGENIAEYKARKREDEMEKEWNSLPWSA